MPSLLIASLTMLALSSLAACVVTTAEDGCLQWLGSESSPTAPLTGCEELWYGAPLCICTEEPGFGLE